MKHHSVVSQEQFIRDYLNTHVEVSVVESDFHDAFVARFGGRIVPHMTGAQPVHKAMRLLAEMHRRGELERVRIGLPEHPQGFPNWVYSYSLKGKG